MPSWHHLQASRRSDEVPSGRGACACCRTQTAKRMIYYYFGRKEQLFEAVLEQAYSEIRAAEQDVRLDHLDPLPAIPRTQDRRPAVMPGALERGPWPESPA